MMSDALIQDFVSFDEYLEAERDVEIRREYVDGQVYVLAGASEMHNTIATTLCSAIDNRLPDQCRVWQSDMKVVGETGGQFFSYYPDIMASCEENTGDPYARSNPGLIVEVLSPTTRRVDLKEKCDNYIRIPSLLEYVVVSYEPPHVRVFRHRNSWQIESYFDQDSFVLESVDLKIQVDQIYRRVRREAGLEVKSSHLD